jgi:hypothetical protein
MNRLFYVIRSIVGWLIVGRSIVGRRIEVVPSRQFFWLLLKFSKNLPKENNRLIGETSDNLVTLFYEPVSDVICGQNWISRNIVRHCHQGDQRSMLWSQFSAIFDNFRWKNWSFSRKKNNVMINILHNLALFLAKNANFLPNFSAKIF